MANQKYKSVIILAHILTTVPAEDLEEYFNQEKVKDLFFIGHPLMYKEGRPGSHYRIYKDGKLIKTKTFKNRHFPLIVQYILDTCLTTLWIFKTRKKWDLIISLDNLNTFAALFLRKVGRIKKVIYYAIDFTPQRFQNPLLNTFYHNLDKFCVKHADLTWNVSPRIAEGREKVRGLDRKIYNKQITVPIGIWYNRISKKPFNQIEKHTAVYAGGLSPHQGIQLAIESIPGIVKKIADFKFIIIGLGSYEEELKNLVKNLKIEKYVNFLGYFEKHEKVEKILSNCGLALAMYSKDLSKWSYYADPSKIKTYLATGLPVITTSLTHIAPELEKRKCGIVIDYDKKALADIIVSLMQDSKKQKEYRENAFKFAKEFDWNTIFAKGLKSL